MNNKITIRDVAAAAGVSISTVHQALNGKKGVGNETRKKIRQIADELGYQPNQMASGLKRKTRRIGVILPDSPYYGVVWQSVRDYLRSIPSMNIECEELPFSQSLPVSETRVRMLAAIDEKHLEGILMAGHFDLFTVSDWKELRKKGIAVSLIGADSPESGRIICVMPDYRIIGRTMAELILSHIPPYGSIAMCAGNPRWKPHAQVAAGFEEYMRDVGASNRVYRDNTWDEKDDSYIGIVQMISHPDVAACCSVLARSSLLLGRALEETKKAGILFSVGSDLSEENISYLKSGIFNNLIQKNPYAQGYLCAKALSEYLVLGLMPGNDVLLVGSEVVFRSNVSIYRSGNYFRTL